MDDLKKIYEEHKDQVEGRLEEFRRTGESSEREIFAELCFCILTPQSRALAADKAVRTLRKRGFLFSGSFDEVRSCLNGVRFPNNKARYICQARERLSPLENTALKDLLREKDIRRLRRRLVKDVKGMGIKEASHFLRNIGRGSEIAILDRHILKGLVKCGVINAVPPSLTEKLYYEIEEVMKKHAENTGIPLDAMDLVFWYMQTGYFFK